MRALVLLCLASSLWLPAQPTGSVSGTVLDAKTGAPVKGAIIFLNSTKSDAVTDALGRFLLTALSAGEYAVGAEAERYAKAEGTRGLLLRLAEGQQVGELEIRMMPEAVLAGRVVDETGGLVPAHIEVTLADRPGYIAAVVSPSGEFRVRGRPAGSYKLSAQPTGSGVGTPLTWYPSAASYGTAEVVRLEAGQTRPDLAITLAEVGVYRVSGRFTGEIAPGSRINVWPDRADRQPVGAMPTSWVDAGGNFSVRVAAGKYRLKLTRMPMRDEMPVVVGVAEVRVVDKDVDGVVVAPLAIRSVRGRFRMADTRAVVPSATFALNPTLGMAFLQDGVRDGNGAVLVERVGPDLYTIMPKNLPAGTYVKSILAGGADITIAGLDLVAGSATEIEIVLGTDGAVISGTVVDAAKRPKAGARVSIWPESTHQQQLLMRSKSGSSDASGAFQLDAVAPGKYRAAVSADGKRSEARVIDVKAGERLQLQLAIP